MSDPVMADNGVPRRIRVDLFAPAEQAIWQARGVVEAAGAHPRLTDAVILLSQAQNLDWLGSTITALRRAGETE